MPRGKGGMGSGMWRTVAAEDTVAARRCEPIDQTRLPHVDAMRTAPLRNLVSAISPAAAPLHFVPDPHQHEQHPSNGREMVRGMSKCALHSSRYALKQS